MFRLFTSGASVVALLALSGLSAFAQTSYSGFDSAGPGAARPLSDAALAGFQAGAGALGSLQTLDFESQAVTTSPVLTPAPGVTITFNGQLSGQLTISSTGSQTVGFNTTPGGSNYLAVFPATLGMNPEDVLFTFATPIQAFGAYFTGLETVYGVETLRFTDGVPRAYALNGSALGGGVTFFGFTESGASISQIVIHEVPNPTVRDLFGIDDVQFVSTGVPEPSALALLGGLGVSGIGFTLRRKRRERQA